MAQWYLTTQQVDVTFNAWWSQYGRTVASIPRALARTHQQIGPPVPPDYIPPPYRFAPLHITAKRPKPAPKPLNKPVNVVVIPDEDHINNCYPQTAHIMKDNIRFYDASDMITKLRAHSKQKHAKIKKLIITGHGNTHHMWIGQQLINVYHLRNDKEAVTQQLAQLKDLLAEDAVIELRGCQVGENQQLMKELSKVVGGAKVQATTAKQSCVERELEGKAYECDAVICRPIYGNKDGHRRPIPRLPPHEMDQFRSPI